MPAPTNMPGRNWPAICERDGCRRPIRGRKGRQHRFCSALCSELERMLGEVERTCKEIDHPELPALWAAAVLASDAATEVLRMRSRLWKESQTVSQP